MLTFIKCAQVLMKIEFFRGLKISGKIFSRRYELSRDSRESILGAVVCKFILLVFSGGDSLLFFIFYFYLFTYLFIYSFYLYIYVTSCSSYWPLFFFCVDGIICYLLLLKYFIGTFLRPSRFGLCVSAH